MRSTNWIRVALGAAAALNALGVAVFLPLALGRPSALLPVEVAPYFAAQLALVIGIFGGVYAWLATQPVPPRPLMVVGGLGKLGFWLLTVVYAALGDVPGSMVLQTLPDGVFGTLFLWWVLRRQ